MSTVLFSIRVTWPAQFHLSFASTCHNILYAISPSYIFISLCDASESHPTSISPSFSASPQAFWQLQLLPRGQDKERASILSTSQPSMSMLELVCHDIWLSYVDLHTNFLACLFQLIHHFLNFSKINQNSSSAKS